VQKFLKYFLIFLLGFILIAFISVPSFVRKAIVHGFADLDDYRIFSNQPVVSETPQPWFKSVDYNKKPISADYLRWINYFQTTAFVVIKDGNLLHESYYNGYTSESISNSFSVAKSIISLLMGAAILDGKIKSIEEPVFKYFPPFNTPSNKDLKIIHLLTMSSGLNWEEGYSSLFSPTTEAYYGDHLKRQISALQVINIPGQKFCYQSCNTQVLSYIIENATGKSIAEYAEEKLWRPMGATHTALWSKDNPHGDEKAYCCFFATAEDFAKVGQLILNKGKWNGVQLIDSDYLKEATKPATWLKDGQGNHPLDFYGYQFWLAKYRGENVVMAQGLAGQYIFVLPSSNLVVVRLGHNKCKFRTANIPSDAYIWLNLAMDLAH
jgi:CubicO group peptidase (beta-lactamase class C family)